MSRLSSAWLYVLTDKIPPKLERDRKTIIKRFNLNGVYQILCVCVCVCVFFFFLFFFFFFGGGGGVDQLIF